MSKLQRTNVFLSKDQRLRLKRIAEARQKIGERHVSVAWLIRQAIDELLQRSAKKDE